TFFFQAEDGIRDFHVTGVQTCALPIWLLAESAWARASSLEMTPSLYIRNRACSKVWEPGERLFSIASLMPLMLPSSISSAMWREIGRASCRERVWVAVVGGP